jgi:hypothetical protein
MSRKKLRLIYLLTATICYSIAYGQSTWPSLSWANSVNLSAIMPVNATELSGLYWNNALNRLYIVGDAGSVTVLQLNKSSHQFSLMGFAENIGGPEGITQTNNLAEEFYTIDENSYEIRKYMFNSNFNAATKLKSWNLLQSPSPMTNTDNTGPEGIAFVPDWYLQKSGFKSTVSGQIYVSKKGMGGLMFIAHQDEGYVWVFDVNPTVNNDFAYVGKYKTNRSESCDLSFENSTGLLYILHNVSDNYLEVTDLHTSISNSEYKFNIIKEYFIPNPASGSNNIEGFAISPKFPDVATQNVWLCRDVTKDSEITDAIKGFSPFSGEGTNLQTDIRLPSTDSNIIIQQYSDKIILKNTNVESLNNRMNVQVYDALGKSVFKKLDTNLPCIITLNNTNSGIYFITISEQNNQSQVLKFIKFQ